jgi:YidC/Oxa1 family membrane protein insertase
LAEIDGLSQAELKEEQARLEEQIEAAGSPKEADERIKLEKNILLAGYCWERRARWDPGAFDEAVKYYGRLTRHGGAGCGRPKGEAYSTTASIYSSVADMRIVQISEFSFHANVETADDPNATAVERQDARAIAEQQKKSAVGALERASNYPVVLAPDSGAVRGPLVLLRDPPVGSLDINEWRQVDIRHEAYKRLDTYNREKPLYKIFQTMVRVCGGEGRDSSFILAIILIAVLAKLITTPLSAAQYRSIHAMQQVQPELKKLQEKYKDDKQKLAKEQMELFRKHGVNPAASCLPMLIQMPILIGVYYGIRSFVYNFENVSFLYIDNLANPDVVAISGMTWPGPLLLLYGVSMYASQKLIATPAATPEQQQQQKLMAIMMPVLLVVILKALPAAFILYWFLQNILMTGHQYLITRPQRLAAAGPAPASPPRGGRPAGESPADGAGASGSPAGKPPPEAMEKLSQGSRRRKKKKRRR